MRSLRSLPLVSGLSGASAVAVAALLVACSSASDGGPVNGSYQPAGGGSNSGAGGSSGGGSTSGGGSSSGGSTTGGGTTSGGGSSSGGAPSGSGSSSGATSGGSDAGASGGGSTISADTTWADGTKISASTTIASGVTVTIAKGATIAVASGVTITVSGTLTAAASAAHAKLTGTGWTGIVVAKGGTLTLDSLDFSGASAPMDVSGTATYSNGTITAPTTPIDVETGGSLTMTTVTITGSLGFSRINGSFTASHLDYDSNGNEGVTIGDPTAVVKVDNSKFHGTSASGGDMITSNACASLTMTYTSIVGCHCAYHFNNITSFDLENMDLHGDSYGFMMYGSSPSSGTRVFKNSNVEGMAVAGLSESGTNGAITVSGVYFDSASKLQLSDQEITVTGAAPGPLGATQVGPQ